MFNSTVEKMYKRPHDAQPNGNNNALVAVPAKKPRLTDLVPENKKRALVEAVSMIDDICSRSINSRVVCSS